MELEKFKEIHHLICSQHLGVTEGKMMSSPAICFGGKVFAFFSRKNKMVFKLGAAYPIENHDVLLLEFNPFKKRKPLTGWYEVGFEQHEVWFELAETALKKMKKT